MYNVNLAEGLGGTPDKLMAYGLGYVEGEPEAGGFIARSITQKFEAVSIPTTPIGRGMDG